MQSVCKCRCAIYQVHRKLPELCSAYVVCPSRCYHLSDRRNTRNAHFIKKILSAVTFPLYHEFHLIILVNSVPLTGKNPALQGRINSGVESNGYLFQDLY